MSPNDNAPARVRCPICRKPSDPAFAPFCSAPCRDRDLLNWLDDSYVVPGPPVESSDTMLDKP